MPTCTRYSEGDKFDYTPSGAVAAGDVVDFGNVVGIAEHDIPANTKGAVDIVGIWKVPKKTGETWTQGQELCWDAGTTSFSNDSSYSEAMAGIAAAAAASGDTYGYIKLTPGVARS